MFRKILIAVLSIFITAVLTNCGGSSSSGSESEDATGDMAASEEMITLTEVISPNFPDAVIELTQPLEGSTHDPGAVWFEFNVKNYQLGVQTMDAETKQCANSADGQHIHLILNNGPYSALYNPFHESDLEAGRYVALAFLSRSYHESLKHYGSYVLTQFSVGDTEGTEPVDLTKPHLFYSRPKGEYQGDDTEKTILDFYLVNTNLSPEGNKVRATINGEQFMIDKWAPFFIEGLPMGESTIKLELLDGNGNLIESPFNNVERTITLSGDPT